MTASVRCTGLTMVRGDRLLFERLDLHLGAGDGALVTGPNGIGKSTLLAILAGLLRPDAGDRRIEGRIAWAAADRDALDPRRSVTRALRFWATLDGRRNEVVAALDMFGIGHLAEVPVRLLSTGQRRRVALARVVTAGADLWLLDEPANGLDGDGLERLESAVARHRAAGGIAVIASHQPMAVPHAIRIAIG